MFGMPWQPHYTRREAEHALEGATSWRQVLDALGYRYHGKNIATVRKWAANWGLATEHLSDRRGNRTRRLAYSEGDLRRAIAESKSWAETLRRLGYCPSGGNWRTLKKRAAKFGISTDHFDPYAASRKAGRRIPLDDVLVEGSTYDRRALKRRLYEAGLKQHRCELCGQGELWRGKRIALILDHANGVRDDNRLENLRIVCPNCAATLETHCGRNIRTTAGHLGTVPQKRTCLRCGTSFLPKYRRQQYCSRACGSRWDRRAARRLGNRKVDRPPHERLLREVETLGYLAVGRKYGVSDNAVRKWLRAYERKRLAAEGDDTAVVNIPTRTWPNRRRNEEAA